MNMKIDRDKKMPLFLQAKQIIIEKIKCGEWKVGDFIPTESEMCKDMDISRFPLRQAMDELVNEGVLQRTRGKGTQIISRDIISNTSKSRILGLLMTNLTVGVNGQILTGFEQEARRRGYLTVVCCSEDNEEEEYKLLMQLIEEDISGIAVFSSKNTKLASAYTRAIEKGIYFSLLDRNPGIEDVDYVGTDNMGGTYLAIHHLKLQGFQNVIFVSDATGISSVNERLLGYHRAVEDFKMKSLDCIIEDKYITIKAQSEEETVLYRLKETIEKHKEEMPIGIFCINDYVAMRCIDLCENLGFVVGKDVGIVGFDNVPESSYYKIPITTIEQNSILVGKIAAELAISKIEGKTKQINCNKIPTQLIVRDSCGEHLHNQ